ncbi:MAG: PEGA domain-containing protein [Cyclobacteriaceae bacterium]
MNTKNYFYQSFSIFTAWLLLFSSCASTTLIQSNPSGAKIYLNNEPVGMTPYTHTDTRIVGSTTLVELEKEGYYPLATSFSRDEEVDVGAVIGGIFVLFPFLWTMKYKPQRTFEMTPLSEEDPAFRALPAPNDTIKSKADRLRELKKLLDEGIITEQEFIMEKKKILDEK